MKTTLHYSQVPQTEKPMEGFPKPNTIPAGWDLSDMTEEHQEAKKSTSTLEFVKVSESASCPNH